MTGPIRHLPEPSIVPGRVFFEITNKTFQDRFLLKPSKKSNDCILGILGRAVSLFPDVEIYAFTFLSDHFHLLIAVNSLDSMAGFMNHIKSCIARKVGKLWDWFGHFWDRRYRPIPIGDQAKLLNRFQYILGNGCKEGLVSRPEDWPGVNCSHALLEGETPEGTWHDESREYESRRSGKDFDPQQFDKKYPVPLKVLPMWEALSSQERKDKLRELLDQIAQEAREEREKTGRSQVLGEKTILEQSPEARPAQRKRSPAPFCHCSTLEGWKKLRDEYRDFLSQFRMAAQMLKQNLFPVTFPPHCFIPRLGYQKDPVPLQMGDNWVRQPAPG